MVFSGTLDIARHLDLASSMPSLGTEALEIPNVEMVAAFFEIDDCDMEGLLPPALHPTIPPTVQIFGMKVTEGPLGAFSFAQVRVGCRAGVRPRGYTTLCFCDSVEASTALSERWGFPVQPGEVIVQRNYDRVQLLAEANGRRVLSLELMDPLPINGADVQYTASVNLAKASHDGDEKPWLIQVDPDYAVRRADRARPTLHLFDAEAWAAEGVIPVHPITGSYTMSDMTLPALRYLMDPAKSAFAGTVSLKDAEPA